MNPTAVAPTAPAAPAAPVDPMAGYGAFSQQYSGPQFAIDGAAPAASPDQTQVGTPPAPKGKSGVLGWLERNAQTIGGVAGGIAGEVIDPFGGAVIGSALGSGLGQEVKNKTTGTNTNPFEEAAIGGASELGGQMLGKGAAKLADKAGEVADKYGVNLLSQVGGTVDRRTARAFDANTTTRYMSDLGLKPNETKDASRAVIDTLTPLVNKGVGMAGNVDTSGLPDMVDSLINNETGLSGMAGEKGTEAYKLSQSLKSQIEKLGGQADENGMPLLSNSPTRDILAPSANPSDTLDTIKTLQKQAAQLTGNGKNPLTITDRATAEASIRRTLASELEDRLYEGAGANDVVTKGLVDDNTVKKLQTLLPNTPASAEYIDSVKNAGSIKDLRTAQAPFVKASQLAAEKEAGRMTEGATSGNIVKQGIGAAGLAAAPFTGGASAIIPAAELALGTDTGKTVTGTALRKVAPLIDKAASAGTGASIKGVTAKDVVNKAITQSFPHILGGAGLAGGATNPGSLTSSTVNGQTVPGSTPLTGMVNTVVNNYVKSVQASTEGNNSMDPATLQRVVQQGGLQGLSQYENYVKMTQPQLTQDQQNQISLGLNSLSSLQQLAPLWEAAVGGSAGGAGGSGILNDLSKVPGVGGSLANGISELMKNSPSGASYKTYMDNRYELASNLAKLVSSGGRSGGVANTQYIEEQLPTLSDSPTTAMQKFTKVASMVNSALQNVLQTPATNTYGKLTSFSAPGSTANLGSLPANPSLALPTNMNAQGAF